MFSELPFFQNQYIIYVKFLILQITFIFHLFYCSIQNFIILNDLFNNLNLV